MSAHYVAWCALVVLFLELKWVACVFKKLSWTCVGQPSVDGMWGTALQGIQGHGMSAVFQPQNLHHLTYFSLLGLRDAALIFISLFALVCGRSKLHSEGNVCSTPFILGLMGVHRCVLEGRLCSIFAGGTSTSSLSTVFNDVVK